MKFRDSTFCVLYGGTPHDIAVANLAESINRSLARDSSLALPALPLSSMRLACEHNSMPIAYCAIEEALSATEREALEIDLAIRLERGALLLIGLIGQIGDDSESWLVSLTKSCNNIVVLRPEDDAVEILNMYVAQFA